MQSTSYFNFTHIAVLLGVQSKLIRVDQFILYRSTSHPLSKHRIAQRIVDEPVPRTGSEQRAIAREAPIREKSGLLRHSSESDHWRHWQPTGLCGHRRVGRQRLQVCASDRTATGHCSLLLLLLLLLQSRWAMRRQFGLLLHSGRELHRGQMMQVQRDVARCTRLEHRRVKTRRRMHENCENQTSYCVMRVELTMRSEQPNATTCSEPGAHLVVENPVGASGTPRKAVGAAIFGIGIGAWQ